MGKTDQKKYQSIVSHYESCFAAHGDNHLGVGWPKEQDVDRRFRVMLDVIKENKAEDVSLLDFGCGTSHLYGYIQNSQLHNVKYSGLDMSTKFLDLARKKYPHLKYYNMDILEEDASLPMFDYIIMNGVFTQKRGLSFDEMWDYFRKVIEKVFVKAEKGIAFNVMSKHVDWENEGNFYLGFDVLAEFLSKQVSKNFVFRHDYGLFEYTTYVYK